MSRFDGANVHDGRMKDRSPAQQLAALGACRFDVEPDLPPALARRLSGRDLFRVDLGAVTSKYIGETEKHLERLFEAAAGTGVVLVLDEADALFGKRSNVADAHDRYANIDIGDLVQSVEAHGGTVMLATNMKQNLDAAFLRRLRFVVQFPFPDRK